MGDLFNAANFASIDCRLAIVCEVIARDHILKMTCIGIDGKSFTYRVDIKTPYETQVYSRLESSQRGDMDDEQ